MPAYNSRLFVRKAVESVLAQTFRDFELVIVDDHSSDGTLDALRDVSDPRIRIFSNSSRIGGGANWNRSVSLSTGSLIKVLCSDDIIYPSCLEEQVRILDDPVFSNVGLVGCWRDVIDPEGIKIMTRKWSLFQGHIPGRTALRRISRSGTNPLGEPGAVLFRRSLLKEAGPFDGANPFVLDIDMWSRLLLYSDLFVVPNVLAAFRVSSCSWSVRLARGQGRSYRRWLIRNSRDPRYRLRRGDVLLGLAKSFPLNWARFFIYRRLV